MRGGLGAGVFGLFLVRIYKNVAEEGGGNFKIWPITIKKCKVEGVKIEKSASVYKKCRGERVKGEKRQKKRIFNGMSEIFFMNGPWFLSKNSYFTYLRMGGKHSTFESVIKTSLLPL